MHTVTHFSRARIPLKDPTESFETNAKNISICTMRYLKYVLFYYAHKYRGQRKRTFRDVGDIVIFGTMLIGIFHRGSPSFIKQNIGKAAREILLFIFFNAFPGFLVILEFYFSTINRSLRATRRVIFYLYFIPLSEGV